VGIKSVGSAVTRTSVLVVALALAGTVLGGTVLGGTVLGGTVLGGTVLGGTAQAATPVGSTTVLKVPAARQRLASDLGVNVYLNPYGTAAQQQADDARILNYVVSLGANSVAIDFLFGTNGLHPTKVYAAAGKTPSVSYVALAVQQARARGLRVLLRPLLDEGNLAGRWRGVIAPPDVSGWFGSYWQFLKPYLQATQQHGAQAFDLGVELDSLSTDTAQWGSLERSASQVFKGQLPVAINHDQWSSPPAALPVPYPAVDAYPVLAGTSAPALTDAWSAWLGKRSAKVLAHTMVQEVGIAAVRGAQAAPWKLYTGSPIDVAVQRNWLTAACSAIRQAGMPGLYFYGIASSDNPAVAPSAADTFSFVRRGDSAIKSCFNAAWK
jgi:hypothetical protein